MQQRRVYIGLYRVTRKASFATVQRSFYRIWEEMTSVAKMRVQPSNNTLSGRLVDACKICFCYFIFKCAYKQCFTFCYFFFFYAYIVQVTVNRIDFLGFPKYTIHSSQANKYKCQSRFIPRYIPNHMDGILCIIRLNMSQTDNLAGHDMYAQMRYPSILTLL